MALTTLPELVTPIYMPSVKLKLFSSSRVSILNASIKSSSLVIISYAISNTLSRSISKSFISWTVSTILPLI